MNDKGMTLLEVLIAAMLLSVGLLSTVAMTGLVLGYNQLAIDDTTATALASDLIEEIKNNSYISIPTLCVSSEPEPGYTRTCTYTPDSPANDMTTINVIVSWIDDGTNHSMTLRTIVAK